MRKDLKALNIKSTAQGGPDSPPQAQSMHDLALEIVVWLIGLGSVSVAQSFSIFQELDFSRRDFWIFLFVPFVKCF